MSADRPAVHIVRGTLPGFVVPQRGYGDQVDPLVCVHIVDAQVFTVPVELEGKVARALLRGMARDRFLVVPGGSLKAYYLAANTLGPAMRLLQRVFLRIESRR